MQRRLVVVVALACASVGARASIIAVDAGSEFAKVAIVKPGMPFQVIQNLSGKRKTTVSIGIYNGERAFAVEAENLAGRKPQAVSSQFGMLLGRNYSDPFVAAWAAERYAAYDVAPNVRGGVSLVLKGDSAANVVAWSVEEASAQFMQHMREFTELATQASARARTAAVRRAALDCRRCRTSRRMLS